MMAMTKQRVVAVIPARMAASRFPGKPLAKILNISLIEHVRRRALLCKVLDDVVVATCDQVIVDEVVRCGGKAVMTKDTHVRCTDRVEEAMTKIKDADIVVILQGDEPLFDGAIIDALLKPLLDNPNAVCSNILTPITDAADLKDPDIVKAVMNIHGQVLYFSRANVPYQRVSGHFPVFRQTGLSAFRATFLKEFSALSPTPLEIIESVDFMRILEHRYAIEGVVAQARSIGVDRPDDVAIVEKILQDDVQQQQIYQRIAVSL